METVPRAHPRSPTAPEPVVRLQRLRRTRPRLQPASSAPGQVATDRAHSSSSQTGGAPSRVSQHPARRAVAAAHPEAWLGLDLPTRVSIRHIVPAAPSDASASGTGTPAPTPALCLAHGHGPAPRDEPSRGSPHPSAAWGTTTAEAHALQDGLQRRRAAR
ncbi:hypothetical protein ZWY2020_001222 [Hordeum vulgare]|nr:hypothetical protein ZWY2020_001222 [Hordeum vulgare]